MNSTTYKVAVLNDHLAQYFNHSAVHVPKNIKVFGNYYYYSIRFSTFASKIIFNYAIQNQNEDTAEDKFNC